MLGNSSGTVLNAITASEKEVSLYPDSRNATTLDMGSKLIYSECVEGETMTLVVIFGKLARVRVFAVAMVQDLYIECACGLQVLMKMMNHHGNVLFGVSDEQMCWALS